MMSAVQRVGLLASVLAAMLGCSSAHDPSEDDAGDAAVDARALDGGRDARVHDAAIDALGRDAHVADASGPDDAAVDDAATSLDAAPAPDTAPALDAAPSFDAAPGFDAGCAPVVWFPDCDGDGHGSYAAQVVGCTSPPSVLPCDGGGAWVRVGGDCDDTRADALIVIAYRADCDGDGWGAPSSGSVNVCGPPPAAPAGCAWSTVAANDCDDADPMRHPTASERCNGLDDDCDRELDPAEDADRDRHGSLACGGDDCDDTRASVNTGATETCDSIDDDCDGHVDEEPATQRCDTALVHADVSCTAGVCAIDACDPGYTDCEPTRPGCETALASDAWHCGACDLSCHAGGCDAGVCDDPAVAIGISFDTICVTRASGRAYCGASQLVETDLVDTDGRCVLRSGGVLDCTRWFSFMPMVAGVTQWALAFDHVCALLTTGHVVCAGNNAYGQLGDGTTVSRAVAMEVSGLADAVGIAVGYHDACALRPSGSIVCWGESSCGHGSSLVPQPATGLPVDVVELAGSGLENTCVRRAGGAVVCWDTAGCEQRTIAGAEGLTHLSPLTYAPFSGCGIAGDGGVLCWGWSTVLGDGTAPITFRQAAGPVTGVSGAIDLAAGSDAVCALLADGSVRCWGQGDANPPWGPVPGLVSPPVEARFP
jgi:hypothetical protein